MAEFRWRSVLQWKKHVLSVTTGDSSKWYATIKYMYDVRGDRWHVTMRGGAFWLPLEYTDVGIPPKEYVENLVLLAHDIRNTNG